MLFISNPSRYSFNSCLRTAGGRGGQFWPNLSPIVGPHFLQSHITASERMNSLAMLDWDCLNTTNQLRHKRLRHTKMDSQCCRPSTLTISPRFEFHARIINHWLI